MKRVSGSSNAVYLDLSNNNTVTKNILSNSNYGLNLTDSINNTISSNIITKNQKGISMISSIDNTIYHNNFIGNTNQASDDQNLNSWDNGYPLGGNFWSDLRQPIDEYSGPLQNISGSDGFNDSAYIIDLDSQDNYPFTDPIGNYILLYPGWNLISIPGIQTDTGLGSVFSSIIGSYSAVQWCDPTDTNDCWKHNETSKPFQLNDLDKIDHTMGFWIHTTEPNGVIFEYSGTQPTVNQSITLHPGWNMVGYPSLSSYNRTAGLNNLTFDTHIDSIWTYDSAKQKYKQLTASDYFEIGKGYYIHAKEECTWVVPL
jgi:parallel beta-helix repeat protein